MTAVASASAAVSPDTYRRPAAPRRTVMHVRRPASQPITGPEAGPACHPPRPKPRVGEGPPPPPPPLWPPPQLQLPPPPLSLSPPPPPRHQRLQRGAPFLQANINHCACAQDLLLQSMAQWSINIAVVAEPYSVWPRKDWVADLNGSVAIISSAAAGTPTLEGVRRGQGCVAARFGEFVVVGVYFSPNRSLAELHNSLAELRAVVVGSYPLPVLVLGDFNAKNLAWGSRRTDVRGRMVEDWALETGLVVLNRGSVPTCVRMRVESVVDISFASPALSPRATDWRVMEGVETYSDHRYIRFDVSTQPSSTPVQQAPSGPRWALKQLDRELLLEASIVQAWVSSTDRPADVNDEAGLGPGLGGSRAPTGEAPKRMLGERPIPASLEDGEAGPHSEAGAPCGLSVRIPACGAARRGGQAL
ncbi:unnamed protein product [Parnassius mnemosyne]|uniref:Endonuclease/exonuclease/phosphatase domain-containing protein n=1 Tax=Parnassius mnemosyne TaxID=213953 RepID=A0AAV1KDC5_9NEOP